MKMSLLLMIAALALAPTLALGGDTTASGATGVAGTIGTTAGTPIGSCVPGTMNGVTVPGC